MGQNMGHYRRTRCLCLNTRGVGDAADRLQSAVEAVLPIGASLIPFGALFGTVLLSGLLLGAGYEWVQDWRKNGPARRKFKCLNERIGEVSRLVAGQLRPTLHGVVMLAEEPSFREAAGEVEILADKLRDLGIQTPSELQRNIQSISEWTSYLGSLKAYSRDGNVEYAIRLGVDKYGKETDTPTP